MAKSSDIIKIGFDYRASLEQFEKETNGVFDGISEKAGKQRISIQLDAKNDKVIEKIQELQKLKLDKFTFEFGESGLAEQLKTFDQLEKRITEIINLSKGINDIGLGNGIGNSIVDEKSLNSIIDLFGKMENHLGEIKKVFADVGDGGEFSPLLSTIDKINTSISELNASTKSIGLNMNIDVGSDKELESKYQEKVSKALIAYQRLFDHIKMSGVGGSVINDAFFNFDLNAFDTTEKKVRGIYNFIQKAREDAKALYGGQDVLKQDTDAKFWNQASAALAQMSIVEKQIKDSADTSSLESLFGGKTDLTEVTTQLGLIVTKLEEISANALEFKNIFKEGFNVTASVEEIEKLTSRVKELEDELSKVKVSSTSPVETNISSGNSNIENELKLLQDKKKILSSLQEEYDEEEISEMSQIKSYQEILRLVTKIRDLKLDNTMAKGKASGARQINDSELAKQYEDEASAIRKEINTIEDAIPLLIAFEDLTKKTISSFTTNDELNNFAIELYQCLVNLRGELGLINSEDFSKVSAEINTLKESVIKIPDKKKVEIELEYKSVTPNGELVYRGIAGKDGNYLNVSNDDGAVWWTSQKDLSQTRYTRNGTGSEFSGNLKAKNLFEFVSASTNWQKATNLGDGSDELSIKITDLYNKIEILKSKKEELIKTNQIESQEYKNISIELGSLESQYDAISKSKSNMYGTHMPNDWVKIAKKNGYDGLAIHNIDDDTNGLATSYAVWAKEQIENVKIVADTEEDFIRIHNEFLESASSTPIKDTFQGDKIEQATASAKELDKTLEQAVDVPTDKFDEILSKLDLTESKLGKITKITKQMHIDENGKPVESYTLKDKYGSTEIYGESSNKVTKQLLSANYVEYDSKQAEKESKELLAVEKEITKEIEKQEKAQVSAQKKKWQAFENEQKKYISDQKKTADIEKNKYAYQELLDTIKQYSEVSKRIAKNETLDGDLELAQKLENKIYELQKNPILSSSQIAKSERDLVNLFNQLDTLEKKTTKKQSDKSSAQSAKEQAEAWEKNVKAIQEYMDANTKLNNLKAQDAGTGKKAKEIEYNVKKVEELEKAAKEARATLSSMINPHDVPISDWNKWLDVMKQFDQATEGSAESLAKLEDSLRNMAESQFKEVNDTLSNSEKYLELLKPTEGNRSVSFEKVVQEYDRAVNSLKEFHATLDATTPLTKEQSDKFEKLANDVKKARIEIDKIPKSQRGSDEDARMKEIDKLTKYLDANTRISKKARQELEHYLDILKSGNPSVSVKELHTEWTRVAVAEREAGREGKKFWDIITDKALYGQAAQLAGYYLSLTDFIRYGQEGIQIVRELDTALTEMRKVSDESLSSLERFQGISFDLADDVGTTAKQIQDSTASWMRLGEAMSEASESAQVSNILLNVSEFESIDEATESLVSMSQAYKDLEKIEIVDTLNKLGNEYAISTDGLATALKDSASALKTAQNDFYEASALAVSANTVVQDPAKVGAGLRTISLRLTGTEAARKELEELGEDVSDFQVTTTSKLNQQIMDLTRTQDGLSVSLLDMNGNYRSTYEILLDIAKVWDKIAEEDLATGENRQNALLEMMAGRFCLKFVETHIYRTHLTALIA